MSEIGIISNPHAKINRNDPEHNTLIWYVLGNKGRFEVTSSPDDLSKVCRSFAERKVDIIGIIGGDGTIALTLAAVLDAYGEANLPKIMLLRGGTVNVLATNIGIYGKPRDVLSDFLEFFHSSNPLYEMRVRSLRINDHLGFLFGTGSAVTFLEDFYKNKTSAWGASRFFAGVVADGLVGGRLTGQARRLTQQQTIHLSVQHQAQVRELEFRAPTLLASSLPKLPYGLNFFPDLANTTQHAEMIYSDLDLSGFTREVARSLFRTDKKKSKLSRISFSEAHLSFEGASKYTVDGEILEAPDGKVHICLGPIFTFCSPYGKILESSE